MRPLVILTTFAAFDEAYSLVQVVKDQIQAGLRAGMQVHLIVLRKFNVETLPAGLQDNPCFHLHACLSNWAWRTDTVDDTQRPTVRREMMQALTAIGSELLIICHDICFQEHFLTYAAALHDIGEQPGWSFWHMSHSSAQAPPPTHKARMYRGKLPRGHHALALNYLESERLRHYYCIDPSQVFVLPNARDLSTLHHMDALTCSLLQWSRLCMAEVAMLYPVNMDRAQAKGVHDLPRVVGALQRRGMSARCLVIDSRSSDPRARLARQEVDAICAEQCVQDEVLFASDHPGVAPYKGLENLQVQHLFQACNLFAFPTRGECSPLVLLEAAAAGCLLVLNLEVDALLEQFGPNEAIYYRFGDGQPDTAYDRLAEQVDRNLFTCANLAKRRVLRERNLTEYGEALKRLP
jgi:glycosyltransferase involved in cell wall biosynthesis